MKKKIVRLLSVVFLCSIFLTLHAQGPDDPGDPDGHPEDIPLDPGSWILVAAGVGYGAKKWYDSRHKTNSGENTDFSQENK